MVCRLCLSLHKRLTIFQLYLCVDSITLDTDYHLDDFPGNNNLPSLSKVSLYDKKYQVMNINSGKLNNIRETYFVFSQYE